MVTLDQQRAANALRAVQRLRPDDELRSSYRAYTDRLGPAIVTNGLGQALATERAAAGPPGRRTTPDQEAHAALYDHIHRWLCRSDGGVYPGNPDLLAALVDGDQTSYLRAQAEALAWLTWHKKFCHAELPKRVAGSGEEE